MQSTSSRVMDFLSGFRLSVLILFFMFLITWLGTLSQVEIGLFQSQKKYFESWIVAQPVFGPLHVPLPGGALLMAALAVNLVLGGIVRLRRTWSRAGILITHLGIALLLVAGVVKFAASSEGYMRLYEGEKSAEYVSYHEWEVTIHEEIGDGEFRQWVVPESMFVGASGAATVTVREASLPFELSLFGFVSNADVLQKGPMFETSQPVIDGYFVQPRQADKEAEYDVAACYVTATAPGAEVAPRDGILWGAARYPLAITVGDREFGVSLRKRRFPVPFEIELTRFTHEYHPGTTMPRVFKSDVVVRAEGSQPQTMLIEMNEPLRREGVIAFQSSWGPQGAGPGERLFSVFTVVENPSDQWPLWSCVVIGIGLVLHFGMMLMRYISSEMRSSAGLQGAAR
jgi:hypothetical protein